MPTTTTQNDLAARLRAIPADHLSPYARTHRASLLQSFIAFGRWTENQERMVRRWVETARAPAAPAEQIAGAGLDRLHALFALARSNGLQRPRISVRTSLTRTIDLTPARDVIEAAGMRLYIRSNGAYLGMLTGGTFYPRAEARALGIVGEIEDGLRRMAADPSAEATAYGRLTGACCFCRRPLTDGRSIAVGYGPICAAHYGLAWGDERVQVQNVAVTGGDLAAGADRSATFTRVDRARVRAEIAAAQRREDAELSTGITAHSGVQIERQMDAMFARAETESERRGFESDPDYRASWRNELAR